MSEGSMKKARAKQQRARQIGVDEVLSEYDFSRARPNKCASRYAKGSIVVTLDPGARQANDALRALAGVIRSRKTRRRSRRSA